MCGLTYLPVAIGACSGQRSLHLFAFERCKREHGPASDGRLVAATGEDRGKAGLVAERAERADHGLPSQSVVVADRHVRERVQRAARDRGIPELPERPRGRVDHGHVIVGQELHEGCDERRGPAAVCERRGHLGGATTDRGLDIADGATPGVMGTVRSPHARERSERGGSSARVGVGGHGIGKAGLGRSRRRGSERNGGERRGSGHGAVVNLHPGPLPAPGNVAPSKGRLGNAALGNAALGVGDADSSDLGLEDPTFRAEATGMRGLGVRGLGTWMRAAAGLVLVAASAGAGVVALGPRTSALDPPPVAQVVPQESALLVAAAKPAPVLVLPTPTAPPTDPYADVPVTQIGSIEIPAIGVDRPLFEGIWLTVIDRGPAHWPGTAEPGGWGNVVVAAHRTTHGGPFGRIGELVPGHEIVLRDAHGTFTYVVTGSEVVTPLDIWIVDQHPGRTITLFACHPTGSAAQRLVVHGELVGAHEF